MHVFIQFSLAAVLIQKGLWVSTIGKLKMPKVTSVTVCSLCGSSRDPEQCESKGLNVPYYHIGENAYFIVPKGGDERQQLSGKVTDIFFPRPEKGFLRHDYSVVYEIAVGGYPLLGDINPNAIGLEEKEYTTVFHPTEFLALSRNGETRLCSDWESRDFGYPIGNMHIIAEDFGAWRKAVETHNPFPQIRTRLDELEKLLL